MYIGVLKYGETSYILDKGKLAILDTEDLTVELVSTDDVRRYMLDSISNVYVGRDGVTLRLSSIGCLRYLQGANSGILIDRRLYYSDNNGELYVGNEFICSKRHNNNEDIYSVLRPGGWILAYPFVFMDCIIMRFVYLSSNELGYKTIYWYTVVAGKNGKPIAHWELGKPVGSLAVKIDTISEV